MTFIHQVSIIGTGAVGSALIKALHARGVFVSGLYNRTKSVADKLAGKVEAENTGVFPESLEFLGHICFICVPDDVIKEIAQQLATLKGGYGKVAFVHTSGAKSASELNALQARGAKVASFHPLQTFDGTQKKNVFKKSYISLQGDEYLVKELQDLAEILEARYLVVDEKQKSGLHLSAVFSCNYLTALMDAARQSLNLDAPGIDVTEVMNPLITQTWENITEKGVDESLTGPISRGDAGTVREHLDRLKVTPPLADLYARLGTFTLDIALRRGLDQEKARHIKRILDDAKQ